MERIGSRKSTKDRFHPVLKPEEQHLHLIIILRGFVLLAHNHQATINMSKIYIF